VLLEEAVLKWHSQQRSSGFGMRGVELNAETEKLKKQLKLHSFTCSSGWLWRFRKVFGEALSGDVESVEPFRKN
jgi:hypothetical protein